jgi:uncharacterized repeat protein (TIGR01451 family)
MWLRSLSEMLVLPLFRLSVLCVRGVALSFALVLALASQAMAATLDWGAQTATDLITSSLSTTAGGVSITVSGSTTDPATDASRVLQVMPTLTYNGHTGLAASQFDATTDNGTIKSTFTLTFSVPVSNVSFTLVDIDGGTGNVFNDTVKLSSVPAPGFPAATAVGSNVTYTAATGTATANGAIVSNATSDLTVNFAGPLTSLSVVHIADNASGTNPQTQVIAIDDVSFTVTPTTVSLQKITTGAVGGPFTFVQTNLAGAPASITTTTAGVAAPASPTAINVSTLSTDVTVTETPATGFVATAASCTDANSAVTNNTGSIGTLSGSKLTIPAANVKSGSNFTCIFTNALAVPKLTVVKSADTAGPVIKGQTITYTYSVTNSGNVPLTNVTVSDSHNGTGTLPVPGSEALVTDAAPAGDTTDATSGNALWSTLGVGDTVKFTSTYLVTQADIDLRQ